MGLWQILVKSTSLKTLFCCLIHQENKWFIIQAIGQKETGRNMHRNCHLNMRKKFFPVLMTVHWNSLPREAVEPPSLEILENCLDTTLCNVLWDDPAWARKLAQKICCCSFRSYPYCGSVIIFLHQLAVKKYSSRKKNTPTFGKEKQVLDFYVAYGKFHRHSPVRKRNMN